MHGAVLMAITVLLVMSNYENDLYDQLVLKFTTPEMSQQQVALGLLHATHTLLKPRQILFGDSRQTNIRDKLFRSSDIQLVDAKGGCGSYAHVLGRLLQRAGFEIRLAQMKCGNTWGCHILLEANIDGRFVVLDSLFDLAFVKPDGKLANFREVRQNWAAYKDQVPKDYNHGYAYEDVRYTNWDKVPLLMPAAKQVLGVFLGTKIDTLSVRSWVLNVYKAYMQILLVMYVFLLLFSIYIVLLRSKA